MKKSFLFSLFFIGFSFFIGAQMSINPAGTVTAGSLSVREWTKGVPTTIALSAQTAMAASGYLVTPGDVYALGFLMDADMISYTIAVDNSYKIRVANLAVLDVTGKTYIEVKAQVEAIMARNYPMSGVQFLLTTPAAFKVIVKGEVTQTSELNAWGLSRLSATIASVLTDYSSIRDITVTSKDGKAKTYDLFRALRYGDLAQDPLLRPGDVVTIARSKRTVTLAGAVERPGVYQLLDNEEITDLVKDYGNGFTPLADTDRINLVRYLEGGAPAGNKILLTGKDIESGYKLNNYDYVTVGAKSDLMPVMFIEGAINVAAGASTQVSVRQSVQFNAGENYANLIRSRRTIFSAISDTAHAYVIRGDATIPLNLNPMMYDASFLSEYTVEDNDLLVVPFRQYFVTVSGAVNVPGRYAYIPDRDWEYYIGLAGGFVEEYNTAQMVKITDVSGNKLKKSDAIMPETSIRAYKNSFLYYFNLYSPMITTTLAIITSYYVVSDSIAAH